MSEMRPANESISTRRSLEAEGIPAVLVRLVGQMRVMPAYPALRARQAICRGGRLTIFAAARGGTPNATDFHFATKVPGAKQALVGWSSGAPAPQTDIGIGGHIYDSIIGSSSKYGTLAAMFHLRFITA